MAWQEKRSNGKWRAGYRDAENVRRYSPAMFEYEYQAERWAESREALALGKPDPHSRPEPTTLLGTYAMEQWLARRTGLQPRSRARYARQARAIAACPLGRISLGDLTHGDVERWFAALDVDPTVTVELRNTRLKFLRMIVKQAILDRALLVSPERPDPVIGIVPAKPQAVVVDFDADLDDEDEDEPEGRWLPPEHIEALLEAAAHPGWQHGKKMGPARMMFGEGQLELAILLGCEAGLRWGEIGGLGRKSFRVVDGVTEIHVRRSLSEKGRLGPTKSGVDRWVPASTRLTDAITRQQRLARISQRALLITRPDGSPIRYGWSLVHLRLAAEQAGIPPLGGWHDLRHTYGSVLADHDTEIQRIADLMGHSASDVTRLYIHRAPMSSLRASVRAVFG